MRTTPGWTAARRCGLGVLTATVVSACGVVGIDYRDGARPTQVAVPSSVDHCPSKKSELPRFDDQGWLVGSGRLPGGFQPVRTVRCRWVPDESGRSPADVVIAEDQAPVVTPALLSALELPDQEFTVGSDGACPAIARSLEYLVLVDATGAAVVPHVPRDPCGDPRAEVERAVAELGLETTRYYRFDAPA